MTGSLAVVTISFNQGTFLEECVESVRACSVVGQHIIVDPGSSDHSREIIANSSLLDPRIIAVFERDSCPAEGLNNGLKHVASEYVMFVNADDYIDPVATAQAVSVLNANRQFGALVGAGWRKVGSELSLMQTTNVSLLGYGLGVSVAVHPSTIYRKSAVSGITFNQSNTSCWDGEFLVAALERGVKFLSFDQPLSFFRIHAGSISGSGRLNEIYRVENAKLRKQALSAAFSLRRVVQTIFRDLPCELLSMCSRILRRARDART